MDLKRVLSFPPYPGDYLHPVVYACTAVMLLCLLVSIVTYIVHHSVIRISRNGWHMLLNFFFHTGLTFGVFASGINQINLPLVCQIVGIVLHYASLSTMLWLTFTAINICTDVSKDQPQAQEKNGPAQTRTKAPVLRFYLVSDGIPLIIVGVTAAFGMDNYGSRDDALYCWMAWEPSLGGFYVPMSALVVVMSVYFLRTYIYLKRHPERRYELRVLSEEEQQLSSSELNHHCHIGARGASVPPPGDCQPFHSPISVLANEHSFKSQLRATAFTLFLFLATWALGAMAVSLGHFLDMIFSCLYGAFCVTLGLFLLIQHCAKRDDVWHRWWACCPFKSKTEVKNGDGQNQAQGFQPHCHQNSHCPGKQLLFSPHLMQSPKMTPPPQSPTPTHTDSCCMAVISPSGTSPISPHIDPVSSPCPQSLPDGLPCPTLPSQSCLIDRTKSSSFSRPRLCLQNYHSHMNSSSMDGSMHSSHLDSTHNMHQCEDLPLVSNSPHPDLQLPCLSPHLDNQLASCHSLQRQTSCQSIQESITSCQSHAHNNMHDSITSCHSLLLPSHVVHTCQWHICNSANHSPCEKADPFAMQHQQDRYMCRTKSADKENLYLDGEQKGFPRNTLPRQHGTVSRRGPIGRNRSLQEDSLSGSEATGNMWTGRWKNETPV